MRAVAVTIVTSLFALGSAHAAAPKDAEVVESTPCPGHREPYADYLVRQKAHVAQLVANAEAGLAKAKGEKELADSKRNLEEIKRMPPASEADYQRLFGAGDIACTRIVYGSDGLRVVGYVMRQTQQTAGAPLLLFLRGGNREFGRVDERFMAAHMLYYAAAGYVVVAPQYRGTEGGEGTDEFGGADVNDVFNIVPIAKQLPNVAPDDLFVFGGSRGGMMAYLALARGLPAKAAVVLAGPTDLAAQLKDRPQFDRMFEELIPNYRRTKAKALRDRSALFLVDKLNAPILLLHGTNDWRVNATNALTMATRLQEAKKPYGLFMYPGGDHGLSAYTEDVRRQVLAWFTRARNPPAPAGPAAPTTPTAPPR